MKVAIDRTNRGFRYTLERAEDDLVVAENSFFPQTDHPLTLVNDTWEVQLPPQFTEVHPDAHAAAIWLVLGPFIGSVLELPLGVSPLFASKARSWLNIDLPNVDEGLAPRRFPEHARTGLLFSGGVDSLAATRILPKSTAILLNDRIPHCRPEHLDGSVDILVDMIHPRALCDELAAEGFDVYMVRDDHENLFEPYPTWHNIMFVQAALYMCDSLGLGFVESGDVLDCVNFNGYIDHLETVDQWRFTKHTHPKRHLLTSVPKGGNVFLGDELDVAPDHPHDAIFFLELLVGLHKVESTAGLTEIATAKIVFDSEYRGKGASCYYASETNYCMKCDKCFKKLILDRIFADREVEPEFIESFMRYPYLAAVFKGPFMQWHHIWYYIFQRIRCSHPWIVDIQRQAMEGPDLSMMIKWYTPGAELIPLPYRDEVIATLTSLLGAMTPEEVHAFESLAIPPLDIEPLVIDAEPPVPPGTPDEDAGSPPPHGMAPVDELPGATSEETTSETRPASPAEPASEEQHAQVEGGGETPRTIFAGALRAVIALAAEKHGASLFGWALAPESSSSPSSGPVIVTFTKADEELELLLGPLDATAKYFVATEHHGISYSPRTPPATDEMQFLIKLVKKCVVLLEGRSILLGPPA